MILSADIKAYRLKKKYTQQEVADRLNISRQSVSKWETGQSFPSIENLILLSELLNMPLDFVNQEKSKLPLPFDFGKPKNRTPFLLWFFFPLFFLFIGIANKEFIFIFFSLSLVGMVYVMSPFDFKRYYNYFSITEDGLTVFADIPKFSGFPFWSILKGVFGKRKTRMIAFCEIDYIEIFLETRGFEGFNTSVSFRPRQSYSMREEFSFVVVTRDHKKYDLSLDNIYYSQSNERKYFLDIIHYMEAKGVSITDKFKILDSLQKELDFIAEAYKVQSSKPNQYVIKSQLKNTEKI
ncbi:helix-turn-helix domain-containing protein [Enterococcus sp. LJL99]